MGSPAMFLMTKDKKAAEKMKQYGLQLACETSGIWEFVFDGKFQFDEKSVKLTNKLIY